MFRQRADQGVEMDGPPPYSSPWDARERSEPMSQEIVRRSQQTPHSPMSHSDAFMRDGPSRNSTPSRNNGRNNNSGPSPNDIVIAVMGITGAGKTTFIQQFCSHDLNVGHGLESCTSKVEVIPCQLQDGRKIFLIDTPGFDDTYRSDTDILRDVADWLSTTYQNLIRLTGIIYLHRISDVRIGGSGMKNLRMFRKLCGERGLGSVVLATTMWSLCPPDDAARREDQLVNQNDLWKHLMNHGARVFRQDDGAVSGKHILDYLIDRAQPVVLEIQHEMVDQGMKLSETNAGREVQEELERMKEKHEKEMREIREEMEEAVKAKDEERQAELKEYRAQIDRQMAQAAAQARQLEASREQLRKEMQAQHAREMQELRQEVDRRQKELAEREAKNMERNESLLKELRDLKEKTERKKMTGYYFENQFICPQCGYRWMFEGAIWPSFYCGVCKKTIRTGH